MTEGTNKRTISFEDAELAVNLSVDVYEPEELTARILRTRNEFYKMHIQYIEVRNTLVAVLDLPECQLICFCGSDDVKDWVLNATAVPWRYAGQWMHAGFVRAHKMVWSIVDGVVDYQKPVILCGHSLGGALAEISALFLQDHTNVSLVTVGKPNVFARWSRPLMVWLKAQLSVVSGSDIVTRSPRFMYGPSKGQDMLYFANSGEDLVNPTKKQRRQDYHLGDILSDHHGEEYRRRFFNHTGDVNNAHDLFHNPHPSLD